MYDTRTGQRVGMSIAGTNQTQARRTLAAVRRRDARGGRPDLHDSVPFFGVVELTDETWGSQPGDVIAPARSAEPS